MEHRLKTAGTSGASPRRDATKIHVHALKLRCPVVSTCARDHVIWRVPSQTQTWQASIGAPMGETISRRSFLQYGAGERFYRIYRFGSPGFGTAARCGPAWAASRFAGSRADARTAARGAMRAGARYHPVHLRGAICAHRRGSIPSCTPCWETNPDALGHRRSTRRRAQERTRARGAARDSRAREGNIATGDKMMTTAGSLALVGVCRAPRGCAARRQAARRRRVMSSAKRICPSGRISGRTSRRVAGARESQCASPSVLDRNPCGSSSGTGAAIAANFAAVGIGDRNRRVDRVPIQRAARARRRETDAGIDRGAGIIPHRPQPGHTADPMTRTVARRRDTAGCSGGTRLQRQSRSLPGCAARASASRGKKVFGYSPRPMRSSRQRSPCLKQPEAPSIIDPPDIPHLGDYDDSS